MSYTDWLHDYSIMVREDWLQGTPWIGGSPNFQASKVDHMTKHYMGGNNIDCSDIPRLLRNMQNDYRNSRGYDLGYSFGSDQAGNLYEIRGLRVRAASDGDTAIQFNYSFLSRNVDKYSRRYVCLHGTGG